MHSTLEQLKALKLTGFLEAWQEQQSHPPYHDWSFDERLALLVEREALISSPVNDLQKNWGCKEAKILARPTWCNQCIL